ncbi:hypothetical protein MARPO_0018s0012 [Marchantia polymorpha]|uniref:Uncharacterized protein n=1 Tax=Marchantia polymorpha TaxID=3197 RepID=A0A2R6XFE0_MARPO|nr:hypothetical protein MARPO_0018s0012 [Marchantia polymorpha]|eukprot:PTQ44816.1 hypothetical protein MARPO_0018s0012 [Marchantia polymorpha]
MSTAQLRWSSNLLFRLISPPGRTDRHTDRQQASKHRRRASCPVEKNPRSILGVDLRRASESGRRAGHR